MIAAIASFHTLVLVSLVQLGHVHGSNDAGLRLLLVIAGFSLLFTRVSMRATQKLRCHGPGGLVQHT